MTLKQTLRSKKGAAMSWAILFGLVIFAVISLIISFMVTMRLTTAAAQKEMRRQNDLDQIGEYFVRAIGTSSDFPNKVDVSVDAGKYPWMDTEAKEFLIRCDKDYGYTYSTTYTTDKGSFLEFFRDDAYFGKLTVKKDDAPVLDIVVAETVSYDEHGLIFTRSSNPQTSFKIVEWTTYDTAELKDDNLGFLGRLWKFIGGIFSVTEEVNTGYSVSFDPNGGSCNTTFVYYIPGASDPIALETPTRKGYDFMGWSDGKNVYTVDKKFTANKNMTLTAQWKEQPKPEYTVTFNPMGGTVDPASRKGSTVALPTPTKGGCSFAGWYTAPTGGDQISGESFDPTNDLTLYAHWNSFDFTIRDELGTEIGKYNVKTESQTISCTPGEKVGYIYKGIASVTVQPFGGSCTVSGSSVTIPANAYGNIVVKMNWDAVAYNITINKNGGIGDAAPSVRSYTINEGEDRLFTVSSSLVKNGYDFAGWSISANTSGKISTLNGSSLTVPAGAYGNIGLTAQWTEHTYTITLDQNGGSGASLSESTYTVSGRTVTINGSSKKTDYDFDKWSISVNSEGKSSTLQTKNGKTTLTIPAGAYGDITVKASWDEQSCIASGTLITLADGTKKKIEDITPDDRVLVFNHETGCAVAADINFIEYDGWQDYDVINLEWSNGITSRIIYEHGFFDLDLMKYVYIHEYDYEQYIGHRFYTGKLENGAYSEGEVILKKGYVTIEYVGCYSFPSVYHLNFFMEDMLSMPGGISGTFNIFDYGEDLMYDFRDVEESVKTYGLLEYKDVSEYMDEDTFLAYPSQYLNVSIGKGLMTEDDLYYLIERYAVRYASK